MKYKFDTGRLIEICQQNGVNFVGIFGSMARGDDTPQSDIDLLVKFASRKSLLTTVKLERELSESLGRNVDVLTEASINPRLREGIMRDLRILYEA
jgi:uncharacterized protein